MKSVEEIMSKNPTCCTPSTNLKEVARLMVVCDCGEIPVVDNFDDMKPVGVITDRDICCRTVAKGLNPLEMNTRSCMTSPAIVATLDMTLEDCAHLMSTNQIRRLPVIDESERVCGMLSQADVVRNLEEHEAASVIKGISKPSADSHANLPQ